MYRTKGKEGSGMEKFIPREKLSKKKKRELDRTRRGSWGGLRPVTRREENPKAYNRRKAQRREEDEFAFAHSFFRGQRVLSKCGSAVI